VTPSVNPSVTPSVTSEPTLATANSSMTAEAATKAGSEASADSLGISTATWVSSVSELTKSQSTISVDGFDPNGMLTDFEGNGFDSQEIPCGQIAKQLTVEELQALVAKTMAQSSASQSIFMESDASPTPKRPLDETPDSQEEAEEATNKPTQPPAKQCKAGNNSVIVTDL
jgi:hypothetical protein